jgi:hypothetical protein
MVAQKELEFSGYDRTVLIIGLCSVMLEEPNPAMIPEVIATTVCHLTAESNKIKEKAKPEEDSKLKVLTMGKKASRKKKYKMDASYLKSIENMVSPWKSTDKFEHFRRTL